MSTKATWRGGILTFYDDVTHERVGPQAASLIFDDFIYPSLVIPAAGSLESGVLWCKKIVGAAPPTVAGVADVAGGAVQCTLTADVQKQDAGLYQGDNRCFSLEQGLVWEARIKLVTAVPTLTSEAIWGLVGDWADGLDAILYSVFFTADGSGEIFCEMDDNATDRSTTSGVTVLPDVWHLYRIDATNKADVKFYIDGVGVATGTTFNYAATGANATLQPYIGCYKVGSDAGVAIVQVDFVRMYQKRST